MGTDNTRNRSSREVWALFCLASSVPTSRIQLPRHLLKDLEQSKWGQLPGCPAGKVQTDAWIPGIHQEAHLCPYSVLGITSPYPKTKKEYLFVFWLCLPHSLISILEYACGYTWDGCVIFERCILTPLMSNPFAKIGPSNFNWPWDVLVKIVKNPLNFQQRAVPAQTLLFAKMPSVSSLLKGRNIALASSSEKGNFLSGCWLSHGPEDLPLHFVTPCCFPLCNELLAPTPTCSTQCGEWNAFTSVLCRVEGGTTSSLWVNWISKVVMGSIKKKSTP